MSLTTLAMSLSQTCLVQNENFTAIFVESNVPRYQKVDGYIPTLLFVTFTTLGLNLFWRKSFVLSRDMPVVLLSELFAIVVLTFKLWEPWIITVVTVIACCLLHHVFKSGSQSQKPRNSLDGQDVTNFILTACSIYALIHQNNQMLLKEKAEEKQFHLMKLWISIPILSLFQLIR